MAIEDTKYLIAQINRINETVKLLVNNLNSVYSNDTGGTKILTDVQKSTALVSTLQYCYDCIYFSTGGAFVDWSTMPIYKNAMTSTADYIYIGAANTFNGVNFDVKAGAGAQYTLTTEYFAAAPSSSWVALTTTANDLDDGTSGFTVDGTLYFNSPTTWGTSTVNAIQKYWIRIYSTTTVANVTQINYIFPFNGIALK